MNRRGGCLWLLVGLFLAVVAGGLAFTAMLRASATSAQPAAQLEPRLPVVIVARNVPPRTEIAADDLITKEVPLSAVPQNAVRDKAQAIGKVTTSQLIAGEILLEPRISEPGQHGTQIRFKIEPGQVVMAFPAADLMSRAGILEPGDRVDFLYSIDVQRVEATEDGETSRTETVTFWTLQKVPISAVVLPPDTSSDSRSPDQATGRTPQSILLALDPQDALLLKHLKDTGGIVDIVLRARDDDTEFETEPVNPGRLQERFNITPDQLP